ncbi:MAG: alpha/beta hydrolase, partial [Gemmatimonadetes bacterium]|nr:alpha/beta hydrolase [Gemmatimonadota bacterium]
AQVPALAGAHRVVTMDSRGHGRTTLGSAGLSYRRMARDAYLLLEELGTGPAYVVGWSDGGCTALYMALLYPESVAGIALIGTSYNTGNYSERSLRLMESLLRPGSAGLLAARAAWSAAAPEPRRWGQFAGEMRRMWRNEPDLTPGDLGHVTVPALVIGCDRDEFLAWPGDPLKVFRETAQAVPRAEMRVIPGGTHTVLVRRPAELNAALLEFLDGGGAAGRIP